MIFGCYFRVTGVCITLESLGAEQERVEVDFSARQGRTKTQFGEPVSDKRDKNSEVFEVQGEVHQGSILSLALLLLVIDEVFHTVLSERLGSVQWTVTSSVKHPGFADNI